MTSTFTVLVLQPTLSQDKMATTEEYDAMSSDERKAYDQKVREKEKEEQAGLSEGRLINSS